MAKARFKNIKRIDKGTVQVDFICDNRLMETTYEVDFITNVHNFDSLRLKGGLRFGPNARKALVSLIAKESILF